MKCAICHEKLDPRDIEYDPKKPYHSGGRTITQNGRALHGSCHNIVTHKANIKKAGEKRKPKPAPKSELEKYREQLNKRNRTKLFR